MHLILADTSCRSALLPLTFTRPVAALRVGILTIAEKWELQVTAYSGEKVHCSWFTQTYLQTLFPLQEAEKNIVIAGNLLPTPELVKQILALENHQCLADGNTWLAYACDRALLQETLERGPAETGFRMIPATAGSYHSINALHDLIYSNDRELRSDFALLTKGRISAAISPTNRVLGEAQIFLEEGAVVECSNLNATTGPIFIGKDAEVMEGSSIRGPFALGEHAQLKMNSKVYGPTTIGPHCKAGGEIARSVLMGYSNKGHDGFLGDSYLGEWCNLGADTNNSNLKNNYADVKLWSYEKERFVGTGQQFCGLIMGDHSKCGINTMFNTGTVVGICANIFGSGFPRNFVPDFSWGGAQGFEVYQLPKVFETAELVMKRRNIELTTELKDIYTQVFEDTKKYR